MHSRYLMSIGAILAASAILGGGPTSAAMSAPETSTSISSLVLTVRELPAGFKVTTARVITNSLADQIGHVPAGTNARSGRITGYQEVATRKATSGLTEIRDVIGQYKTRPEAQLKLTKAVHSAEQGGLPPGFRNASVTNLGNKARAFTYTLGPKSSGVAVYFARGRYVTEIIAEGAGKPLDSRTVVALARIVDGRITKAKP